MITSLTNETVKYLTSLKTARGRKLKNEFLVEGQHLVSEAKNLGILVCAYTIDSKLEGELISEQVMKKISMTDTPVKQVGVCKKIEKNTLTNKVLMLDKIQDPGNMGALMRSAKAFGFDTLFLCDGCVDIYNDKVIRSSQGAFFKLNYIYGDKIDFLNKHKDYTIYGTNVRNGIDVSCAKKSDKYILILGNEGQGISEEINNLNLDNIYIPIKDTESLNVAVAGGILMYELRNKTK